MKIRNMLCGIPLLLLMVSGLSIFFLSCKGPASPNSPKTARYTITFEVEGGNGKLTATAGGKDL
ncbi:MAG: hypothetical protein ACTTI3_08630, partial [Treponema sp.]